MPELKEFDAGYNISEELKSWLIGKNTGITVKTHETSGPAQIRAFYPIKAEGAYELGDLSDAPANTQDLIVLCKGGNEIDFEKLSKFTDLRTLTVYSDSIQYNTSDKSFIGEEGMYTVKNITALKNHQNLYSLSLCGAKGDLSGIAEISFLKQLSIVLSKVSDTSFISKLGNLMRLTYLINLSGDISNCFKSENKAFSNLELLNVNSVYLEDVSCLKALEGLEALRLGQGPAMMYTNNADGSEEWKDPVDKIMETIGSNTMLKYFSVTSFMKPEALDVAKLAEVGQLQYIYVRNNKRNFSGISELIGKNGLKSLVLVGSNRNYETNKDDINWMELGVKNQSLGRLQIDGMWQRYYRVYRQRLGDDWFRSFLKERREIFKTCFANRLTCGGYEEIILDFGTIADIESFVDH